jgi:dihydrofolate synthase / folylpolyglutamate synthase
VRWVALEVGLGGRLDATNIVTPKVSVVVSIGYDHMSILGNTLAEIAFEKAGIIKPGIPAVVGKMAPEALLSIEKHASENDAELWRVGREVEFTKTKAGVRVSTPGSTAELTPSLFGDIQLHNAAVAYAALELAGFAKDQAAIQRGIASAYIPGRFTTQVIGDTTFILDGAHNYDSARALAQMLFQSNLTGLTCITGMLTGHEPAEFYESLRDYVDQFYVVPIDFYRTRNAEELAGELSAMGFETRTFKNTKAALEAAQNLSESKTVLVTGSFYLVGEAMRLVLR